jgi:acetolactate synthase-1/2/3 large subunit
MADAIAAASGQPRRQVATLIVPADCQWDQGTAAPALAPGGRAAVAAARIERAASILRGKAPVTLFLGGDALGLHGLDVAARIAAGSGCTLLNETFPARIERGAGIPAPVRLPYFPEQALAALAGTATLLLAGASVPVAMFGYPDGPSSLVPEGCALEVLAGYDEDVVGALESLAELVGTTRAAAPAARTPQLALPTGALTVASLGAALAALQPEGAIIADESATSGGPYGQLSAAAPPHTVLGLTGGAIGHGFPTATGAALACPGRRVIALQADGSGLYTLQALWTQAREGLNVTTLICSNRLYRILQMEAARAGAKELARNARTLTELAPPEIGWVDIARGFGVPGARVTTADDLVVQLRRALSAEGPYLIDVVL